MNISELTDQAQQLSKKLELVKTTTSKEIVEEYEIDVEKMINELKKEDIERARQIDELRGERRLIDLATDLLKTDKKAARNLLFSLIEDKKIATMNSAYKNQPIVRFAPTDA